MQSFAFQTSPCNRLLRFRENLLRGCPLARTHSLVRRTTLRIRLSPGSRLRCLAGLLWITSTPGREDILLQTGETWISPGGKAIVVEALENARFEILPRA